MKMVRFLLLAVSLVSALTLAACGSTPAAPAGGEGGALTVTPDGENLAYKPAELKVKAGSSVSLAFNNSSTAQQHNIVIVTGGDDVAAKVDEEAIAAGAPDYIPADKASIVAATKMLAPGGSETVSFTAPAAGTYVFLCTYPGHYAAGMKGTLVVEP
ncbi:MAG: plastocyanin/azurin family copper-binding protein [Roseiflexaceae bacterium]